MISSIGDDNPVMYFFHKGFMGLGWMPSPDETTVLEPEETYTIALVKHKLLRKGKMPQS